MQIVGYLGQGAGFGVLLAIMLVVFAGLTLVTIRSSKREYAGRILIPIFFIQAAICFLVMSLGFPIKGDAVGPSVVPNLWIFGILILSVGLLLRGVLGREPKDPTWGRVGVVAIFATLTILYLVLMQVIGYFVATLLYLVGGMYYLKYRNWKVMILLAAGWIAFSYFAFYRLLYLPLPRGILMDRFFS